MAFSTWPNGEWMIRWISRKPARNTTATSQYIVMSFCSEMTPNRKPRGTCWMPSSPPVNGASTQKKYTICASASVIIAK